MSINEAKVWSGILEDLRMARQARATIKGLSVKHPAYTWSKLNLQWWMNDCTSRVHRRLTAIRKMRAKQCLV